MARGAEAKSKIQKQILETFSGSFLYNDGKEIRVPITENGELVQIKIALTCAKENVEIGADNAMPGDFPAPKMTAPTPERTSPVAPSEQEKQNVANLLKSLGL
jgi:hypothetical protein